eukprot:Rhum_TRINITY_DN14918_c4_g1::Rhum_TRINITY_DN14918_c4_g1_i1::g.127967::m.127967
METRAHPAEPEAFLKQGVLSSSQSNAHKEQHPDSQPRPLPATCPLLFAVLHELCKLPGDVLQLLRPPAVVRVLLKHLQEGAPPVLPEAERHAVLGVRHMSLHRRLLRARRTAASLQARNPHEVAHKAAAVARVIPLLSLTFALVNRLVRPPLLLHRCRFEGGVCLLLLAQVCVRLRQLAPEVSNDLRRVGHALELPLQTLPHAELLRLSRSPLQTRLLQPRPFLPCCNLALQGVRGRPERRQRPLHLRVHDPPLPRLAHAHRRGRHGLAQGAQDALQLLLRRRADLLAHQREELSGHLRVQLVRVGGHCWRVTLRPMKYRYCS